MQQSRILPHLLRTSLECHDSNGVAPPQQVTTLNCSIGALFRITTDTEILSHMNHLAIPALGESFAVEIQA